MDTSAFIGLEEPLAMKAGSLGHTAHLPGAAAPQGAVPWCSALQATCAPHLSRAAPQHNLAVPALGNHFSELKPAVNIP